MVMMNNVGINNQEQTANAVPTNPELYLKANYLVYQNPFLIDVEIEDINHLISLDDFYINHHDLRMSFNDLILSTEHSRFFKKKMIKQQFLIWKKEYITKEKLLIKSLINQKEMIKNLKYQRFSIITLLVYLLTFFSFVILYYQTKLFIKSSWLYQILIKSKEIIQTMSHLNLLGLAFFGSLFLGITYGIYQNIVLKTYYGRHKVSKRRIKNIETKVKIHFRRQYKLAKNHFSQSVKGKILPSYRLNKIVNHQYQFGQVDKISQIAVDDASRFKRNNRMFKIKKFLLHLITIGLGLSFIILITVNLL